MLIVDQIITAGIKTAPEIFRGGANVASQVAGTGLPQVAQAVTKSVGAPFRDGITQAVKGLTSKGFA